MENQNNYKKDIEKQKESLRSKLWRNKERIALTLALILALGIGGCHIINGRNKNVDDVLDDPDEFLEDQDPSYGNTSDDDKLDDEPEITEPIASDEEELIEGIGEDEDLTISTIIPDGNVTIPISKPANKPASNGGQNQNQVEVPGAVVVPNEGETKDDEHDHRYVPTKRSYIPYGVDKHIERTIMECVDGDSTRVVDGLPEDCSYVLTSKNAIYEYWTCSVCGRTKAVKHSLGTGVDDGKGTITYNCENDGCDYSHVEKYTPGIDNNNSNNNNNGNNNNNEPSQPGTPSQPEEPSVPTDPVGPSQPAEPSVPSEPVEPDQPEEPSVPSEPVEPDQPEEPSVPSEPVEPDQPEEPSVPSEPVEPDQPGDDDQKEPDQPGDDDQKEPDQPGDDEPDNSRDDLTQGTPDGDGFVGGGGRRSADSDQEQSLSQLYAFMAELLQVQQEEQTAEELDTPGYTYDYKTNTLRLSK